MTTARKTDSRNRDREGIRTMGASRDYTTGNAAGNPTALLERGRASAPQRTPARAPHRPQLPGRGSSRLGSKQVVSQRGRRVGQPKRNPAFARISVTALTLLVSGVALVMWLSGVSTAQTFKIQSLTVQESQLSNQLETLNRDLENVRSSADVARRAEELGLGIPVQPGVVGVDPQGNVEPRREAKPETESLFDVNGEPIRPGQASSDPEETKDVSSALSAVPRGEQAQPGEVPGRDAPASPNRAGDAPADAAANLPAQAPYLRP